MTDHFKEKAEDWDSRPLSQQISTGVGQALRERIPLGPDLEVMDFGAGTGLISTQLAPRVKSICAVDVSASMLERLAAKPALAGKVETVCQDILKDPLDRQFDLIVSAMALHHVEDTGLLLKRFVKNLRPGGAVALADLDTEAGDFHPPGTEGVFHAGFDRTALAQLLEAEGFRDVQFSTALEVDRETGRYPIFLVSAYLPG